MTSDRIRLYPATILLCSMAGSILSPVSGWVKTAPYQQEVLVTAYYSPEPDQCCYFRGSYEDEIIFNGEGTHGADKTPVYEGMLAAPKEIPFGTRINLPGIGVGTVHDRGGWINMVDDGNASIAHIDIWVGRGEEGLARALAWGSKRMTATIFPAGTDLPDESIVLNSLPAPSSALNIAKSEEPSSLLLAASSFNDHSASVRLLQDTLQDLGYVGRSSTGRFGEETKAALAMFQKDHDITGDGSIADDVTRARLMAALQLKDRLPPDFGELSLGTSGAPVQRAQGVLRFLGDYKGRTTGMFDNRMQDAVIKFQLRTHVIDDVHTPGAGRIGPKTKAAIITAWRIKRAKSMASPIFLAMQVTKIVLEKHLPMQNLMLGSTGDDVKRLQRLLLRKGLLTSQDITGTFGEKTEKAVEAMQLQENIITTMHDHGAGVVGPMTRKSLEQFAVQDAIRLVRSKGLSYL